MIVRSVVSFSSRQLSAIGQQSDQDSWIIPHRDFIITIQRWDLNRLRASLMLKYYFAVLMHFAMAPMDPCDYRNMDQVRNDSKFVLQL